MRPTGGPMQVRFEKRMLGKKPTKKQEVMGADQFVGRARKKGISVAGPPRVFFWGVQKGGGGGGQSTKKKNAHNQKRRGVP